MSGCGSGPRMARGTRSSPKWSSKTIPSASWSGPSASTPARSGLTSTPLAPGKRGLRDRLGRRPRRRRGSPRPVPRRTDDQAAPGRRWPRAADGGGAASRSGRGQPATAPAAAGDIGRPHRARTTTAASGPGGRRQGLLPPLHPDRAAQPRNCVHLPGEVRPDRPAEGQGLRRRPATRLRPGHLCRTQRRRTLLRPTQAVPVLGHPLRQTSRLLSDRSDHRRDRPLAPGRSPGQALDFPGVAARRWRVAIAVLALAAFSASVVTSLWLFPLYSVNRDDSVYVAMARLLEHGHVTLPAAGQEFFRPWASAVRGDRVVLKYTPPWPSVLAAADLVTGTTRVGLGLTAAATVVVMALFAGEVLRDRTAGIVAGALLALSPVFVFQSATYLPYV